MRSLSICCGYKPTPSHPTGLLALITTTFSGAACLVCNPSCFHLLWQIQHHFSKCLYSCTARPLFRSFPQLNFIRRSRDRNFLGKIVSVYPRARQPTASVVATSVCAATRLRLRCRDRDSAIIHQNMHTGCFFNGHKKFSVQKCGARFVETRRNTTQGTECLPLIKFF